MDFGLPGRSSEFSEDIRDLESSTTMSSEISLNTIGTFGQNRRQYESSPTSPCFTIEEASEQPIHDFPYSPSHSPSMLSPSSSFYSRPQASNDSISTIGSSRNLRPKERIIGGPSDALMPFELLWLRDTTVKMMIEQEAFRTVSPTFSYAGYSPTLGLAYFMPPKRQIFVFHYLPFDAALPILRRITLNEDENKDYLSRHINLTLKHNGVYTVSGTEPAIGTGQPLEWHFEYIANPGKTRNEGERTLTPLTFSCSPGLLLPSQGRKIKLIQVMHKTLIGKLSASKLDPPDPSKLAGQSARNDNLLKVPDIDAAAPMRFFKLWNSHRRAVSHTPEVENIPPATPSSPTKKDSGFRRRRSSSAGQAEQPNINKFIKPTHHILEPSQATLSTLL